MKRLFVTWLIVVLAIAGISAGLGFYKYSQIRAAEAAAAATPEPSESVGSVRARRGEWSATTRAIGTVVALRQLEVRNELAGTIAELGFTSGSVVEAGQLLVQLDTRQEQASLAAAVAEAQLAQQTLQRREGLRASAAYSPQELDKARAELDAATARARGLQVTIDKKRIVAPFRARIGITNLQPGTYLEAGTSISRLQGVDEDAYVDFSLPRDNAGAIRIGTEVAIASAAVPGGPPLRRSPPRTTASTARTVRCDSARWRAAKVRFSGRVHSST